jgi:ribosome-associated heat shock protein Hsp15
MGGRNANDEQVSGEPVDRVRIDRWVWAARFVKSRELAADAVKGGRVQVNGERVKPSRPLKLGDRLEITIGEVRRAIVVRGITDRRGPAVEAALLYEETAESVTARELQAAERRLSPPPGAGRTGGRPTKRDRRRLG